MRYLSHMLPYETESKRALDGIAEFQLLVRSLQMALCAFQEGNLEQFDGLVGENACQIRALWVVLLSENHKINFNELLSLIDSVNLKISQLIENNLIKVSLKEVLISGELDILIPQDAWNLLQFYLLTQIKVRRGSKSERRETMDLKQLQLLGDVTVSFAKKLISKLRKEVAAGSVALIKQYSPLIDSEVWNALVVHHNECWACVPMFLTYQTILSTLQQHNIPIVIHVRFHLHEDQYEALEEAYFYYMPVDGQYRLVEPSEEILSRSALLIQGMVAASKREELPSLEEWKRGFDTFPLATVILAGAADHRQYPDSSHDHLFELIAEEQFYELKNLAKQEGFSIDNPSTFLIQHVYATQGKKVRALHVA